MAKKQYLDLAGLETYNDEIQAQLASKANSGDLTSHTGNKSNPHGVTKAQVGLGNVENKSSATIRGELTKSNVTTALGYTPPTTNTTYGVVSTTADGLAPKLAGGTAKYLRADGTWATPPDNNTTYSTASSSTAGLVKIGYTESGKNYPVELNSSGQMYVNVPWTDNNTIYSNFVKSGSGAKAGLVPAPSTTAGTTKYLREDGTWAVPPDTNTTYSLSSFGITATAAELNYCDGVTSNIQTQLNGKAASSHTHTSLNLNSLAVTGATILTNTLSVSDTASFYSGVEISHNTPYIDFHYAADTGDYTSRIIESASGTLTCSKNWAVGGTLKVSRTTTLAGVNSGNIYSSGFINLGGKKSKDDGKAGVIIGATGNVFLQGSSAPAINFYKGTATTSSTSITVDGNSNFLFKVPSMDLLLYSSAMRTSTDNSCYLGAGSYKWKAVYAGTGAIQTSDLNQKKDLVKLLDDERYIKLFDLVEPYAYTFKDGDRRHTGFISQYVEEALEIVGLTAEECGFFCKDIKTEAEYDDDGVYIGERKIYDEDGNPIYIYSLRYEEYIAIIGAKLKKLEKQYNEKLEQLDLKLAELEAKLN